ncbi:hypothetical protein EYV94_21915 [Puteibacter caeruleilacunae]|nr:hypothetical protein EYV94_21915 [Puteibacter caeruleilacunae]
MRKTTRLGLALVVFFATLSSFAAKKVKIKLDLKEGTTYEYSTIMHNTLNQAIMGQQVNMDQNMIMNFNMAVNQKLDNGNFEVIINYDKLILNMDINGQKINFDTSSESGDPKFNDALKGILAAKFTMEITPEGKPVRVSGFETMSKALKGNPQMQQSLQMLSNEESFKKYMSQTFNYFPQGKVRIGDEWDLAYELPMMMKMNVDMHFKLEKIRRKDVILDVNSKINIAPDTQIEQQGMKMNIKLTGDQQGNMVINKKDGMLDSSEMIQDIKMTMITKNPQTNEEIKIPMNIKSDIKMTVTRK